MFSCVLFAHVSCHEILTKISKEIKLHLISHTFRENKDTQCLKVYMSECKLYTCKTKAVDANTVTPCPTRIINSRPS
ncbi:hypothetical protein DsansV1_C18g0149651 [Dioscorea sansibarensis]